jgi:hypothetical protein
MLYNYRLYMGTCVYIRAYIMYVYCILYDGAYGAYDHGNAGLPGCRAMPRAGSDGRILSCRGRFGRRPFNRNRPRSRSPEAKSSRANYEIAEPRQGSKRWWHLRPLRPRGVLSETGDGDARRWDARYGTHYMVQQSGTGAAESVTLNYQAQTKSTAGHGCHCHCRRALHCRRHCPRHGSISKPCNCSACLSVCLPAFLPPGRIPPAASCLPARLPQSPG